MTIIPVDVDRLRVHAGPDVIKMEVSVGRTGQRGSRWFSGPGMPSESTIPDYDQLVTNDLYVDTETGVVYQYITLPSNTRDWVEVYTLGAGAAVGGGAVSSVAGRTGNVTLTVSDLTDAASLATDAELAAGLATKANTVHTHVLADVTDYTPPDPGGFKVYASWAEVDAETESVTGVLTTDDWAPAGLASPVTRDGAFFITTQVQTVATGTPGAGVWRRQELRMQDAVNYAPIRRVRDAVPDSPWSAWWDVTYWDLPNALKSSLARAEDALVELDAAALNNPKAPYVVGHYNTNWRTLTGFAVLPNTFVVAHVFHGGTPTGWATGNWVQTVVVPLPDGTSRTITRVSTDGTSYGAWTLQPPNLAIGTTGTTAAAGNRQATETAIGMVELATTAEATAGTDTTRAVTPAGLKAVADTKAPALGADDNYVTDSEKTKLANLSGTNTGDQDLSGYALLTSPGLLGRYVGVNAQVGTTYTPVLSDEGKLVTLTNAAAITVTLPQDSDLSFPVGARTDYVVLGEGMATFVAGTGATVKVADTAVSRKTNSSMTAVKIAADTWLVVGDLA